jgi:hypothetical protein
MDTWRSSSITVLLSSGGTVRCGLQQIRDVVAGPVGQRLVPDPLPEEPLVQVELVVRTVDGARYRLDTDVVRDGIPTELRVDAPACQLPRPTRADALVEDGACP